MKLIKSNSNPKVKALAVTAITYVDVENPLEMIQGKT
jgi:hypothetical protein